MDCVENQVNTGYAGSRETGRTAGDRTTLAVEVARAGPVSGRLIFSLRLTKTFANCHTTAFSECSSGIENPEITFKGPSSMTCTPLLSPSFCDHLRDVLKKDVKKTDGVDANLRKNVGLSRCREEQENWRVRSDVVLLMV